MPTCDMLEMIHPTVETHMLEQARLRPAHKLEDTDTAACVALANRVRHNSGLYHRLDRIV